MVEAVAGIVRSKVLGSLRLRARVVADGYRGGPHRSHRRGSGLEFAGHRAYTPGDDLRWLDQRAVLRQDRLLIKQFETETDQQLQLIIDASASMNYRSEPERATKWEHTSLLATALAQLALRDGDRVGLSLLGSSLEGRSERMVAAGSRPETAHRIADTLESTQPSGIFGKTTATLDTDLAIIAQRLRRGSLIILLSDLLELPESAEQAIASLGAGGRQLAVVQVLDPLEAHFELQGPVRLRSIESTREIETNASLAREQYLQQLGHLQARMKLAITRQGGDFIACCTADNPVATIAETLKRVSGRSRR